jgi:hypothetical protein
MVIYTFFRQPAAGEKKFGVFSRVQMARYTFLRQPAAGEKKVGVF